MKVPHMSPEEMLGALKYHNERRQIAERALAERPSGNVWYFGTIGLTAEADDLSAGLLRIRKLSSRAYPDDIIDILGKSEPALSAALHTFSITHEIVIDFTEAVDEPLMLSAFNAMMCIFRCLSGLTFVIPSYSNRPWSSLFACSSDPECIVRPFETVSRFLVDKKDATLTLKMLQTIADGIDKVQSRGSVLPDNIVLAIDSLVTHHHESDLTMSAAKLWIGLEALVDCDQATKFQFSSLLATYLYPPGPQRLACFHQVMALGKTRNSLIHAKKPDSARIMEFIQGAKRLLSAALTKYTFSGSSLELNKAYEALFQARDYDQC